MEHSDWLSSRIVFALMYLMSIPVFMLAALGIVVTWKSHRKELLVVYIVITLTIAQNIAFYANIRFRAPIEPLLSLLVGGMVWWITTLRSPETHKQSLSPGHKR